MAKTTRTTAKTDTKAAKPDLSEVMERLANLEAAASDRESENQLLRQRLEEKEQALEQFRRTDPATAERQAALDIPEHMKAQAKALNSGAHAWRVHVYPKGRGMPKNQLKQFACWKNSDPFRCDTKDPKEARRIYEDRYGSRAAQDKIQLVLIEE